MTFFDVLSLVGGIALFLYGMDVLGKSLERAAGSQLKSILSKLTNSTIKGLLLGVAVTAVIQSSAATTVMVVGFVNSGLMQLGQAVGVIMGANIGTTVTAWILSLNGISGSSFFIQLLNPMSFTPILAIIGVALQMFSKRERRRNIGSVMIGFAVLMFGMNIMSESVEPLKNVPEFTNLFVIFGKNPILSIFVGCILTAIIQSSSASVGILQALSATGAVTFGSAIPIIMGQHIGTCITAMIAAIGTTKNARRASFIHLYFNVIGTIICTIVFYTLNAFLKFDFMDKTIDTFQIAIVHTLFSVIYTLILLPFALSFVVTGTVWAYMYRPTGGVLNSFLSILGMDVSAAMKAGHLMWASSNSTIMLSIIIAMVWQFSGYVAVIFLAAIKNVPVNVINAAKLDGAYMPRIYFKLIIPQLKGAMGSCITILAMYALRSFDFIVSLVGYTTSAAWTLPIWMYNEAFQNNNFAYSAAISCFLLALVLVLILPLTYWTNRRK